MILLPIWQRILLLLVLVVEVYVDNLSWGSKAPVTNLLSIYHSTSEYTTGITPVYNTYYIFGLLLGAFGMTFLSLMGVIFNPQVIITPRASQSYWSDMAYYTCITGICNIAFTVSDLMRYLKLLLVCLLVLSYYMYRFYVAANREPLEIWCKLAISGTLPWPFYASILLTAIVFHPPNILIWWLLITTFAWLMWISFVERGDIFVAASCLWILMGIVAHNVTSHFQI